MLGSSPQSAINPKKESFSAISNSTSKPFSSHFEKLDRFLFSSIDSPSGSATPQVSTLTVAYLLVNMADTIPEQMRAVIIGCSEAIRSQNAAQISTFYESGGLKFSEKSKQVDWPSVEAVSALVSGTLEL